MPLAFAQGDEVKLFKSGGELQEDDVVHGNSFLSSALVSKEKKALFSRSGAEALDENETLLRKIEELEDENRQLRQEIKERDDAPEVTRMHTHGSVVSSFAGHPSAPQPSGAPQEPTLFRREAAKSRTRSLDAISTGDRSRASSASFQADAGRKSVSFLEEERRRRMSDADAKDEEIHNLRDAVEAQGSSNRQLEEEVVGLKKVIAMSEANRLEDKANLAKERSKVRELNLRVEQLRQSQERNSQAQHRAEQLEDQLASMEGVHSRGANLANELTGGFMDSQPFLDSQPVGALNSMDCRSDDEEDEDEAKARLSLTAARASIVVPRRIAGHLQKKSPSTWRTLMPFQERFFVLETGKLTWWECLNPRSGPGHSHGDTCKGSVDFSINTCALILDLKDESKFSIIPQNGVWVAGNFTNAAAGRVLEFSVTGSEHTLEDWSFSLRAHMEHGRRRAAAIACAISTALFEDELVDQGESV